MIYRNWNTRNIYKTKYDKILVPIALYISYMYVSITYNHYTKYNIMQHTHKEDGAEN